MNFIVLSSGGHARVVVDTIRSMGFDPIGLTDRDLKLRHSRKFGIEVMGPDEQISTDDVDEVVLANGLGNIPSKNGPGLELRQRLFERFVGHGFTFPTLRHQSSVVARDATLSPGVQVLAGAIVQSGARIGDNAIVNSGALVEHDCSVGAHSHVAPRAILCGNVTIGAASHIGAGAILLSGTVVGEAAVVRAGAIVNGHIQPHTVSPKP